MKHPFSLIFSRLYLFNTTYITEYIQYIQQVAAKIHQLYPYKPYLAIFSLPFPYLHRSRVVPWPGSPWPRTPTPCWASSLGAASRRSVRRTASGRAVSIRTSAMRPMRRRGVGLLGWWGWGDKFLDGLGPLGVEFR